jgi:hypothetical protein
VNFSRYPGHAKLGYFLVRAWSLDVGFTSGTLLSVILTDSTLVVYYEALIPPIPFNFIHRGITCYFVDTNVDAKPIESFGSSEPPCGPTSRSVGNDSCFSLASGSLYERFLKILVECLEAHIKSRVFLATGKLSQSSVQRNRSLRFRKNLVSRFVFGCRTNWPMWLRQQTSSASSGDTRFLFLDVLFPLHRQIIYVDADKSFGQI